MNKRTQNWPSSSISAHRDSDVRQTFIVAPVFHFFSLWQCDPSSGRTRRIQAIQGGAGKVVHLFAEIGCDGVPFDEHRVLSLSFWLSDVSGTYFVRENEFAWKRFDSGTRTRIAGEKNNVEIPVPVGNGSFEFGHRFTLPLDKPGVLLVELIDRSGTYGAAAKVLGRSQIEITGAKSSRLDLQ